MTKITNRRITNRLATAQGVRAVQSQCDRGVGTVEILGWLGVRNKLGPNISVVGTTLENL